MIGEVGPEVVGHHGKVAELAFLDLVLGNGEDLVGGGKGDGVIIFALDDAGEDAAVGGGDEVGLVVLADQRGGVEHVGEDVVEIGPVGAG